MKKLLVSIDYDGSQYTAWADDGCLVSGIHAAGDTIDAAKADWEGGMTALTDDLQVEYSLTAAALLRHCITNRTTLTAISKVTGLSIQVLSAYARNQKNPRPSQYKRIVMGIKTIADDLSRTAACGLTLN
jgi:hypothetical protein